MKTIPLRLVLLLALAGPVVRAADQAPAPEAPTEAKALAAGYALAFQKLYQARTITLVVRRDGKSLTLKDVRKVEACEGVLLVSLGGMGENFSLNPRDVLFLTDSPRQPPES